MGTLIKNTPAVSLKPDIVAPWISRQKKITQMLLSLILSFDLRKVEGKKKKVTLIIKSLFETMYKKRNTSQLQWLKDLANFGSQA